MTYASKTLTHDPALSLHCKQLLAVDFWRCQSLTARGVLTLASITTLEELDFGWCVNILASTGCIRTLVNNCRRLKKLFLTAHRQTSDADIEAVAALLGKKYALKKYDQFVLNTSCRPNVVQFHEIFLTKINNNEFIIMYS